MINTQSENFLSYVLCVKESRLFVNVHLTIKDALIPFAFQNDPMKKRRTEDAIVAWTWKKFIENNGTDPEILLRLPMTKVCCSSKTIMITIDITCADPEGDMVSGCPLTNHKNRVS